MKAFVLGATGAVGRDLVEQLLADGRWERVDVAVRRPLAVEHEKLRVHVVDFDEPEAWAPLVTGDVLFICIGTTRKAAGSEAAQWHVDVDYPLEAAQAAAAHGVKTCVLVSAAMADADSRWFYPRMKGELEERLRALPFERLAIARPPVLERRGSDRPGERLWVKVVKAFSRGGAGCGGPRGENLRAGLGGDGRCRLALVLSPHEGRTRGALARIAFRALGHCPTARVGTPRQ